MISPSFELYDFFHLSFLRHLATHLPGQSYTLRGGVCLRFFYRSPRIFQNMIIDISSSVDVKTLRKAVDSILKRRSFLATLIPEAIHRIKKTKPKQTKTLQMWRVWLVLNAGTSLITRIQFQRRRKIISASGIPDFELLARYRIPPFAVQYYGPNQMVIDAIMTLSISTPYAVRVLFDLHHLFYTVGVKPQNVSKRISASQLARVINRTKRLSFRVFQGHLLPFLPKDMISFYNNRQAFEKLKNETWKALMQVQS